MTTTQQTFDISGASEIILEGWGNVQLEQGEQDQMTIDTDSNLLPKLKTAVRGSRLELGFKNPLDYLFNFTHPDIHYHITVKKIDRVQILGSGSIDCPGIESNELGLGITGSGKINVGDIQSANLEIKISGSGDIKVDGLSTRRVKVSIPGSGRTYATGSAPQVEAHISGSGRLEAEKLHSETADVRISGSGQVSLDVSRELDVHISGSGRMRYLGTPSVHTHISGSGSVKPLAA